MRQCKRACLTAVKAAASQKASAQHRVHAARDQRLGARSTGNIGDQCPVVARGAHEAPMLACVSSRIWLRHLPSDSINPPGCGPEHHRSDMEMRWHHAGPKAQIQAAVPVAEGLAVAASAKVVAFSRCPPGPRAKPTELSPAPEKVASNTSNLTLPARLGEDEMLRQVQQTARAVDAVMTRCRRTSISGCHVAGGCRGRGGGCGCARSRSGNPACHGVLWWFQPSAGLKSAGRQRSTSAGTSAIRLFRAKSRKG